jgi:NAD(P)H dehydrogenase (quinone)
LATSRPSGVSPYSTLPGPFAEILVDADVNIVKGELDDHSGDLRKLIGRPTTTLAAAVAAALPR